MDKDLGYFKQVLMWLWHHHERPWLYSSEKARKIYAGIRFTWQSFSSDVELERLLPSKSQRKVDFLRQRKFLYLNPVEKGEVMVPILTMMCDFNKNTPEVRLRVGLFLLDKDNDDKVNSIGYRFETPEGDGRHDYYHAQMITRFAKAGPTPDLYCPNWLPTTHPAFPLYAKDPVSLVLCLLISLYGVDYPKSTLLAALGHILKKYRDILEEMSPQRA